MVLDATELRRDWLAIGFRMQLLAIRSRQGSLTVSIPPSVFEEHVANHGRAVEAAASQLTKSTGDLARLGLPVGVEEITPFDFRRYLLERFDEVLEFSVLDWPTMTHRQVVDRATRRRPPFDSKGGGYRDTLVWAHVLDLAGNGEDVVLVSSDRAFAAPDGTLHHELRIEVEDLIGTVELVQDLSTWLLSSLPKEQTLVGAVQIERDQEFADFYLQSDIQSEIDPDAADIGFVTRPIRFEVEAVEWGGDIRRVSTSSAGEGTFVSEYDVDQVVTFEATFREPLEIEPDWEIRSQIGDEITVAGEVEMVARLAVLFDSNLTFAIEELSWRRSDGTPPGLPMGAADPSSLRLF